VTSQHSDKAIPLGLLGGTFDPIHTGHLLIAEVGPSLRCRSIQVVFVPAGARRQGENVTKAEHAMRGSCWRRRTILPSRDAEGDDRSERAPHTL